MKESIVIITFIIILYIFYSLYINKQTVLIETLNGGKLLVQNSVHKDECTWLLNEMVDRMFRLKNYLYLNINKYTNYKKYIEQLNYNFNEKDTIIYENSTDPEFTSYSVNKGEELVFCLKSRKNGKPHDINLMMYVAIHEMAHIGCPEQGHTPLFNKIFAFLLKEAINIGLYKYENYGVNPVEYCGMELSTSII